METGIGSRMTLAAWGPGAAAPAAVVPRVNDGSVRTVTHAAVGQWTVLMMEATDPTKRVVRVTAQGVGALIPTLALVSADNKTLTVEVRTDAGALTDAVVDITLEIVNGEPGVGN
jgi:hypothetical protein